MASQWPPKKGAAFDLYFSLYKTDGTIIANPGTYTRTVGKDGGASDTTPDNAITEIDTTYGRLKWTLSADEMNADVVEVMCRDDTSGCIPFMAAIYTAGNTLDEVKAMVDDLESRLGTPSDLGSGATVAANLADIEAQTDDIGAAGAGLTAVPWNAAWDAEVQSECADALNAYDPPTKAEMDSGLDALPTAAEIKAAVEAAGSHLALILEDTGTALPGTLATIAGYLDTEIAAILEDTSELQTDLTNGGRLDLLIDAIKAKTDNLPASPAAVGSEMDLVDAPNADALAAMALALHLLDWESIVTAAPNRCLLQAARALRNKIDLETTPGTMIVCKEDDNSADPAWTAAVSTDASAEPITVVDPA